MALTRNSFSNHYGYALPEGADALSRLDLVVVPWLLVVALLLLLPLAAGTLSAITAPGRIHDSTRRP